jgi:indole-3-glycerol phosphate synthase
MRPVKVREDMSEAGSASRLNEIITATHIRIAYSKERVHQRVWEEIAQQHVPRGFKQRLEETSRGGPAVIAELKKASPSKGTLRDTLPVKVFAKQLEAAGACALSVLTEERFFQGSLANLLEASISCSLPCLRKDFIIDESQITEARAYGADAVLLIMAALNDSKCRCLLARARELEIDVICEVHNDIELDRALDGGAEIIAVNSRDLRTFNVDPATTRRMAKKLPKHVLKIAESGITSGAEINELYGLGYQAFLIGEALMRAGDPGEKLEQLLEEARQSNHSSYIVGLGS